jgi:hypothetical protein
MELQLMKIASRSACVVAVICLALTSVPAAAGPLPLDPNAMGGVNQGTSVFPLATFGGVLSLSAKVDFAVFAPGKFNLSYPGQDPSGGTQFVYAYEVFNTSPNPGPTPISVFSVGILPVSGGPPAAAAAHIEHLPLVVGTPPDNSSFSSTSAVWDYSTVNLAVGANSDILLFTSPHPPTMQAASVGGNGLGTGNNLPSPIPEPSTMILLAIGGAALLMFRRRMSGS